MPELPEVETVKRGLNKLIIGKVIAAVRADNPKSFPNAEPDVRNFLIGATVTEIRRRAKVLLIDLSTNYTLAIHLKMTGQLVYVGKADHHVYAHPSDPGIVSSITLEPKSDPTPGLESDVARSNDAKNSTQSDDQDDDVRFGAGHPTDSLVGALPDKSTRVIFHFSDDSHLFFNDQRKFGWIRLMSTAEVPNIDFMKRVGPEPLEADFTATEFATCFKRRAKTTIKAALLDQSVVAGVGNIYADEALWGAKIHPARLVGTIKPAEFKRLYTEVRLVMNLSIEKGGSTNRNYVNAEGKKGSYMEFARVFRREGLTCPRCGTEIIKIRVAGRGTHICPHDQQL
jgi:formamidopyrimidine-DNA glycosylase